MTQIEQYVASTTSLALLQGAGAGKPIIFKTRSDSPNLLVVAFEDPNNINPILPLNVFYICIDPAAATVPPNTLMKRTYSADGSGGYVFGASVVTDFAELSTSQQVYAPDAPEHVILSTRGGQLEASVFPVVKPTYVEEEAAPVSWLRKIINSLRSSVLTMYQNMNNRVISNDLRIRALDATVQDHTYLISQLGNSKFYTHKQDEASQMWVVEHMFPPTEYLVSIFTFDEQGDPVWSDQITGFGEDGAHVVMFLAPCSGHALVIAQPR